MQGLNELAMVQVIHMREIRKALGYDVDPPRKREWHPVLLTTLICGTVGTILAHTVSLTA